MDGARGLPMPGILKRVEQGSEQTLAIGSVAVRLALMRRASIDAEMQVRAMPGGSLSFGHGHGAKSPEAMKRNGWFKSLRDVAGLIARQHDLACEADHI